MSKKFLTLFALSLMMLSFTACVYAGEVKITPTKSEMRICEEADALRQKEGAEFNKHLAFTKEAFDNITDMKVDMLKDAIVQEDGALYNKDK